MKVEVLAKRFLGNHDEEEEEDSTKMAVKDKVERIEKTNQGITDIKRIMCHSLRLYEGVEDMITKMVGAKAKQMLESKEKIDLSKDSESWKELKHRQSWEELVHHEIEIHHKE